MEGSDHPKTRAEKTLHDYLGVRFVADFKIVGYDPEKNEARIAIVDEDGIEYQQERITVTATALKSAIDESIITDWPSPQQIAAMHKGD